jgi:predicted transcriptional regulator
MLLGALFSAVSVNAFAGLGHPASPFPIKLHYDRMSRLGGNCFDDFKIPAGKSTRAELETTLREWVAEGHCTYLKQFYADQDQTLSFVHFDVTTPRLILVSFNKLKSPLQFLLTLAPQTDLPSSYERAPYRIEMLDQHLPTEQAVYDDYIRQIQGNGPPPIVFTWLISVEGGPIQEEIKPNAIEWDEKKLEAFLQTSLTRPKPPVITAPLGKIETWILDHRVGDTSTTTDNTQVLSLVRLAGTNDGDSTQPNFETFVLGEDELEPAVMEAGNKILEAYLARQKQIESGALGGVRDELEYRFLTTEGLLKTGTQLGFGGIVGIAVAEAMLAAGLTTATVISIPVIGTMTIGTASIGVGVLIIGGTIYYVVATSDNEYDQWRRLTGVGVDTLAFGGGIYASSKLAANGLLEPLGNAWWRPNIRFRWPNAYPDIGVGLRPGEPSIGFDGKMHGNGWEPAYPGSYPQPTIIQPSESPVSARGMSGSNSVGSETQTALAKSKVTLQSAPPVAKPQGATPPSSSGKGISTTVGDPDGVVLPSRAPSELDNVTESHNDILLIDPEEWEAHQEKMRQLKVAYEAYLRNFSGTIDKRLSWHEFFMHPELYLEYLQSTKNSVNTDEKIETLASSQDESKAVADENEADKSDAAESTREGNTELVVRALLKGLGIEADSAQVVNETLKYLELSQAYPNFESRIPLSLWLDVTLGLKPTLVNLKTPADIRALRIAILQFREIRANKTDALNVRLDGRLKDALQKLSRETGKPVSRLVGNAINVAYETYKADGSSPLIDDVNTRPPRNTPTQALNVRIDQTTKEHLDELVDEFDSIPTAVTTNIIENLIRVFQEEE